MTRIIRTASLALLFGAGFAVADTLHWAPIGPPAPVESVRILAVGPPPALGLLYVSTNSGVQKTENAGATWTSVTVAASESVVALAIDPAATSTAYASTQAPLPVFPFQGGLYKTTNGGATWTPITTLPSLTVYALAVIASPARRVFAATHQGIYCSPDGGASWVLVGASGRDVFLLAFSAEHPSRAYAFSNEVVYRSDNAGDSWQSVKADFSLAANSVAIDAADPSVVVVSGPTLGPAPGGLPPQSLRTEDGGATWTLFGVPAASTYSFAYSAGSLFAIAYPITGPGGVFRSSDRGASWERDSDGLEFRFVVELAVSGTALYASDLAAIYRAVSGSGCSAGTTNLCLSGARFRVSVDWTASNLGEAGHGQSIPLTADTGAFWFFQPSNYELVVKVLDARAINGHFWLFWGALSNVGYTITVTDTATGRSKTYTNPEGTFASGTDTEEF